MTRPWLWQYYVFGLVHELRKQLLDIFVSATHYLKVLRGDPQPDPIRVGRSTIEVVHVRRWPSVPRKNVRRHRNSTQSGSGEAVAVFHQVETKNERLQDGVVRFSLEQSRSQPPFKKHDKNSKHLGVIPKPHWLTSSKKKLKHRVNIVQKRAGSLWGCTAKSLRVTAQCLVMPNADYYGCG